MIGILGAGKTGRGFIGRLLAESGREFVLFDSSKELINQLKDGFEVSFFSNCRPKMDINNYKAFHTEDPKCKEVFADISLLFISVGGNNLEAAGRWLARQMDSAALEARTFCNVILCENARDPSQKVKKAFLEALPKEQKALAEERFGFADAAVFCTTIQQKDGSVDIYSENYPRLPLDVAGMKGKLPEVEGFHPVKDFENVLMRKIYTYNSASAVIAYLGWWKNYECYGDAANDPEILNLLDRHYASIGKAICQEYGYTEEDQNGFASLSKAKFCDRAIVDTIRRNAREPQRKLSAGERIAGPAVLIQKYDGDLTVTAMTAAAALLYEDSDDVAWSNMKSGKTLKELLCDLSGMPEENPFVELVMEKVKQLKAAGRGNLPRV